MVTGKESCDRYSFDDANDDHDSDSDDAEHDVLDRFLSYHWEALLRLQPRAVVETSPGKLQAWFTLDAASSGQSARHVNKERQQP